MFLGAIQFVDEHFVLVVDRFDNGRRLDAVVVVVVVIHGIIPIVGVDVLTGHARRTRLVA